MPTAVNQVWQMLGDEGLVWGVTGAALPLAPGAVLTLTIGDAYYWPTLSNFSGLLPPGTALYAQVDSANANTTYGAVLEIHEMNGEHYNNIIGPFLPSGSDRLEMFDGGPPAADAPRSLGAMPARP